MIDHINVNITSRSSLLDLDKHWLPNCIHARCLCSVARNFPREFKARKRRTCSSGIQPCFPPTSPIKRLRRSSDFSSRCQQVANTSLNVSIFSSSVLNIADLQASASPFQSASRPQGPRKDEGSKTESAKLDIADQRLLFPSYTSLAFSANTCHQCLLQCML